MSAPDWFKLALWAGNRTVTTCSGFNTRILLVISGGGAK